MKPKDPDADDGPTYVDEESNEVVTKEEYEAMLRDAAGETDTQNTNEQDSSDPTLASTGDETSEAAKSVPSQKVADIGAPKKKKKLGRLVADEDHTDEPDKQPKDSEPPKKKQKKKIKLSFDEAET